MKAFWRKKRKATKIKSKTLTNLQTAISANDETLVNETSEEEPRKLSKTFQTEKSKKSKRKNSKNDKIYKSETALDKHFTRDFPQTNQIPAKGKSPPVTQITQSQQYEPISYDPFDPVPPIPTFQPLDSHKNQQDQLQREPVLYEGFDPEPISSAVLNKNQQNQSQWEPILYEGFDPEPQRQQAPPSTQQSQKKMPESQWEPVLYEGFDPEPPAPSGPSVQPKLNVGKDKAILYDEFEPQEGPVMYEAFEPEPVLFKSSNKILLDIAVPFGETTDPPAIIQPNPAQNLVNTITPAGYTPPPVSYNSNSAQTPTGYTPPPAGYAPPANFNSVPAASQSPSVLAASLTSQSSSTQINVHLLTNSQLRDLVEQLLAEKQNNPAPKPEQSKLFSTGGDRNWIAEFTPLVESWISDSVACKKLANLTADFQYTATLYAQIIVNELVVPDELKTIKPVSIGGIAGGEKYIVGGILFKFALDQKLSNGAWMYGGKERRDDLAMISASKELEGNSACLSVHQYSMSIPLMCVVDILGYRLICSSILPVGKDTLCYGSCDGGKTVYQQYEEVNEQMKQIGEYWNLARHRIGNSSCYLYTAGDIEVHKGSDGKYYVLDFGRFFPPEAPMISDSNTSNRSVFYQFLRKELVMMYKEPLSADAFTGWGQYDPLRSQHQDAVKNCTKYLHETLIPKSAEMFQSSPIIQTCLSRERTIPGIEFSVLKYDCLVEVLKKYDLTTMIHYEGINVRHLGRLRAATSSSQHREFILTHCICRVIKNIIRTEMRETTRLLRGSPSEVPFRRLLVEYFTKVFAQGAESSSFWETIREKIQEKFVNCLSQEEICSEKSLKEAVDSLALLHLLSKSLGLILSNRLFKSCEQSPDQFSMTSLDIVRIEPLCKQTYLPSSCAGLVAASEAEAITDVEAKRQVLAESVKSLTRALPQSPLCPYLTREYAKAMLSLALLAQENILKQHQLSIALTQVNSSLAIGPTRMSIELADKILAEYAPLNPDPLIDNTKELLKAIRELDLPDFKPTKDTVCVDIDKLKARRYMNRQQQLDYWKHQAQLAAQ